MQSSLGIHARAGNSEGATLLEREDGNCQNVQWQPKINQEGSLKSDGALLKQPSEGIFAFQGMQGGCENAGKGGELLGWTRIISYDD